MTARILSLLVLLLAAAEQGRAAEPPAVDFARDIKPLLARRCFACHGPDKAEGGLRLNSREAVLAELETGEHAVVPGDGKASALLYRVESEDEFERMPPEGKALTAGEIDLLRRWIEAGAPWEKHWAFRPLARPEPPEVRGKEWVRNPVDQFILHRLEGAGLAPNPPAEKGALLRRAYYDLIGLPPTAEQVAAFTADDSPGAFERVVDELLASPRYGEHWGRKWLDLVRFAETNSFERDGVKPNAWRYRDYVIRSFNDDKPYDRFVQEQLAGDELEEVTPETITATGYYRLGIWDDEPADRKLAEYNHYDDIVSTTGQVFLALTTGCARCHDHKIDPFPASNYYSLLAFFRDVTTGGNTQMDICPPEVSAQYVELEAAQRKLNDQLRQLEQRGIVKMSAEDQRKTEGRERQQVLREKLRDFLSSEDWSLYESLQGEAAAVAEKLKGLPPRETTLAVGRGPARPPQTVILQRGMPELPGDPVEPAYPDLFEQEPPGEIAPPPGGGSSGRRRVFAEWLTSPENLLTSRVMANRLWQHHFGRGIVRSANNFGQLGDPPTHPELLDWLATELSAGGWRLKRMHKLLMLSSAYQMSSAGRPEALAADPTNNLFWRYDMRRLTAEEIRDSLFAVTGRLNLQMYGPGVYPTISREVLAGQSRPGAGWGNSPPEQQARRSVYIHVKRSLITPLLANFDFPDTDSSCEARFATTQPTQALELLNGEFLHEQARALADRARREAGNEPSAQVAAALRSVLSREPSAEEVERGTALLERLKTEHQLSPERALEFYSLVVLNLNEFLFLD